MSNLALLFKVHQPCRFSEYSFFDLGTHRDYFNNELNRAIIDKVSDKCYLPANQLLKKLIEVSRGRFKFNMSISGVAIEQLEQYRPDVLMSFVELVNTGAVEILCEPYYHSLASLYSPNEFTRQVLLHRQKIYETFKQFPVSFLNTEMLYNDFIARQIAHLGFNNILTEGVDHISSDGNFDKAYRPHDTNINVYLREHNFSNDIGYRFTDTNWSEFPLSPFKYYKWMEKSDQQLINLFLDYETFGEHHQSSSGIFEFFENWVMIVLNKNKFSFRNIKNLRSIPLKKELLTIPNTISWADTEKDASAWSGNSMQYEALLRIYDLEQAVLKKDQATLTDIWRKLQISDHFYYMSTKGLADGMVHNYFSPYRTPHDAYRYYMNIVSDFELLIKSFDKEKVLNPHDKVVF